MAPKRPPGTRAVRVLRDAGVKYASHVFDYKRHPGAYGAAEALNIDPHLTVKTIVFTTDEGKGVVVLMHGDLEVSVKNLAREMGVKSVRPATQGEADRFTGYRFGGTSPLGMRMELAVYAEKTIATLDTVYVNAGSRGFLVALHPGDLIELSGATLASLAAG